MKLTQIIQALSLVACVATVGCATRHSVVVDGQQVVQLSSDEAMLSGMQPFIKRAGCVVLDHDETTLAVQCADDAMSIVQTSDRLVFRCEKVDHGTCDAMMQRFAPPSPWSRTTL